MPQHCRGIFDLLPAAALDITQPLGNLAKGCVVEYVEARDVEPLHHPAAVGVALPAAVAVHAKGWAVEVNGETLGHIAGGAAQVDCVAVAQVRGHRVVPAADADENPVQNAGLIEGSERQRCRRLAAGKPEHFGAFAFLQEARGIVVSQVAVKGRERLGCIIGLVVLSEGVEPFLDVGRSLGLDPLDEHGASRLQAYEVHLVHLPQEPRQLAHVFGQTRHGQGVGSVGIDDEPILALFFRGRTPGPATIPLVARSAVAIQEIIAEDPRSGEPLPRARHDAADGGGGMLLPLLSTLGPTRTAVMRPTW